MFHLTQECKSLGHGDYFDEFCGFLSALGHDPERLQYDLSATGFVRSTGLTPSEQRVAALGDVAFLRMWSYANPFRKSGKELCVFMSIFENDVIVFSVKDIQIKPAWDETTAWRRWYNNAIKESVRDLRRAQRHLSMFPDKVYLDNKGKHLLPVAVPVPPKARYFRIVVALGASKRIRASQSGLRCLRIRPDIIGDRHLPEKNARFLPFAVGQVDPGIGYTHIFDDDSLDIVLSELDTITDFLNYLQAKEELIASGMLKSAASELDLLADYLYPIRGKDKNAFSEPKAGRRLEIRDGRWRSLQRNGFYQKRRADDQVSYQWDRLIEHASQDFVSTGGATPPGQPSFAEAEAVLRHMARVPRFHRRLLGADVEALIAESARTPVDRMTRFTNPGSEHGTYFALQMLGSHRHGNREAYRSDRRKMLNATCDVTKLQFPDAHRVIGISTDMYPNHLDSLDVAYLECATWTMRDQKRAIRLGRTTGLTRQIGKTIKTVHEYPDPRAPKLSSPFIAAPKVVSVKNPDEAWRPDVKGAERNKPCPCGSRRKAKHCCCLAPS